MAAQRHGDETVSGATFRGDHAQEARRAAFVGCVDRLTRLIERESEALRARANVDFEEFNARKTHALLEFSRASRAYAAPRSAAIESKIECLRATLFENGKLLERRLQAMREIAGIMICTIEMAESDGTYSTRSSAER
ncbi:hypothetical protein IY145_04405 [Methylosinus sp. H3A]|uniref:hypothetical protein n=1 Tax=Methylosinus sp. H3A TaxID=2785786 RepID=UPI0018C2A3D7|nr:hypothetical protein [Methylosinus sp. H3A]MBG0808611.1 hypothetical protein [Methylosinus sp. H3A]